MDIVEELKETIADIRDWDGAAMKAWDQSRKLIREGDKSDFPRLIYENTISGYMETMIKAADEIGRLREALKIFAIYADYLDENYGDHPDYYVSKAFKGEIITFGDFRKARSALQQKDSDA